MPHNKLSVGATTIRRDPNFCERAWMKVAERRWRPRAIVVWERENGPVPRGMIVHHRDRDTLNDDIKNLVAVTRAEHTRQHQRELHAAALAAAIAREAREATESGVPEFALEAAE